MLTELRVSCNELSPGRRSQQVGQFIQRVQILAGLLPEIVQRLGAVARVDGFTVRFGSLFCQRIATPGSAVCTNPI